MRSAGAYGSCIPEKIKIKLGSAILYAYHIKLLMETNLKMFIKVSPDFLFLFVHTVYLNHMLVFFRLLNMVSISQRYLY